MTHGDQNALEDPVEGESKQFKVPHDSEIAIDLTFSPVALMSHAFELPLSMQGLPPSAMKPLRRAVCAESARPRLLLSTSKCDFGTNTVVNDNMGGFAYHMTLSATNCDDGPCDMSAQLRGTTVDSGVFSMKAQAANLAIGRSCTMNINFVPRKAESYACKLLIFIDGSTESPYFELEVTGTGVYPSIKFDRREIFLPPSPLGLTQKVTFFVINNGFDNLDLRHAVAGDSLHLPITVSFPSGTMLNVVKQVHS